MLAYSPSAPPLSPAARAQIVAALCERAKQKQVVITKSIASRKATWQTEMSELSLKPPKPLTLPALLSLSAIGYSTLSRTSTPALLESVDSTIGVTSVSTPAGSVAIAPDPVSTGTETASTSLTTSKVLIEEVVAPTPSISTESVSDNKENERSSLPGAETGVVRPSLFDLSGVKEKSIPSVEEAEEKKVPEDDNNETLGGDETGVLRPVLFDLSGESSQEVTLSTSESEESDEEKDAHSWTDSTKEMVDEVNEEEKEVLPGDETRVVRPLLFNGIGEVWSRLRTAVGNRANQDTEKLKKAISLTGSGSVASAFAVIESMKK